VTRVYRVRATSAVDAGYFGSRKAAEHEAQQRANFSDEPVEVESCKLVDHLSAANLACALLSGLGWCADAHTVRVVKPKTAE
jgi:hypothetical protein